jgi:hypothetical protein
MVLCVAYTGLKVNHAYSTDWTRSIKRQISYLSSFFSQIEILCASNEPYILSLPCTLPRLVTRKSSQTKRNGTF